MPRAETALFTFQASPKTDMASDAVLADLNVILSQFDTACALTLPEPFATPVMAIFPVPELMTEPLNPTPKDMPALVVLAFCPRMVMLPPLALRDVPDRK